MIKMPEEIEAFCTAERLWVRRAFQELLDEANAEIESMKCCGNCEYHNYTSPYINCNSGNNASLRENYLPYCENWKYKEEK